MKKAEWETSKTANHIILDRKPYLSCTCRQLSCSISGSAREPNILVAGADEAPVQRAITQGIAVISICRYAACPSSTSAIKGPCIVDDIITMSLNRDDYVTILDSFQLESQQAQVNLVACLPA